MKESIEFERPEGVPASAVPFVGFIVPPTRNGNPHEELWPGGSHRGFWDADSLAGCGLPVPDVVFRLSADVSEEQLREIAGWPVSTKSDRTELVVSGRVVAAAKALVAEIDRSES